MRKSPFLLGYRLHPVLFWMLVFVIWYLLRVDDDATPSVAALVSAIMVIDLALMIYITNYLLIPQLLYKMKYLLSPCCSFSWCSEAQR